MTTIEKMIDSKVNTLFGADSDYIRPLISPAIGIKMIDDYGLNMAEYKTSKKVLSRFGGLPDIGDDFLWPDHNQSPMAFLCQINLEDIKEFRSPLPSDGVLLFFATLNDAVDVESLQSSVKVLFYENTHKYVQFNLKELELLDEFRIKFYSHYTLPSTEEYNVIELDKRLDIFDNFSELQQYISELTFGSANFTNYHMLGDPNANQGAVRPYWGAQFQHPEDYRYRGMMTYLDEVTEIGNEFILLLQLDLLNSEIYLPAFGSSCLYFGIHKNDLASKNFGNVKLVIQNI
jgi:uncharacterized protein YwqG